MALSPAKREYLREYRNKNRANLNSKASRRAKEKITFLWQYKQEWGCGVCGETDPVVLEIDHLDPVLKTRNDKGPGRYGTKWRTLGWDKLYKELENCQVLCANCHRRKTYQDRDHLAICEDNVSALGKEQLSEVSS